MSSQLNPDGTARFSEEVGGARTYPASFDSVIHKRCPDCGAQAGAVCTFTPSAPGPDGNRGPRPRHLPCIGRFKADERTPE